MSEVRVARTNRNIHGDGFFVSQKKNCRTQNDDTHGMIRITHFRNKCIGCNACVETAPDRWRMSKKDGKSVLIGGKEKRSITTVIVGDDELDVNRIAEKMCPTNIIQVEKIAQSKKPVIASRSLAKQSSSK